MKRALQIHERDNVAIAAGESVTKYRLPIGTAKCGIAPGPWVHTHNMKTGLSGGCWTWCSRQPTALQDPRRAAPPAQIRDLERRRNALSV